MPEKTTEALPTPETYKEKAISNISNSVHVQTLPIEYFGRISKSQGTQTTSSSTKTMVTKGTQTYTTSDILTKYYIN